MPRAGGPGGGITSSVVAARTSFKPPEKDPPLFETKLLIQHLLPRNGHDLDHLKAKGLVLFVY